MNYYSNIILIYIYIVTFYIADYIYNFQVSKIFTSYTL
jgi:hypothetical protein